MRHIIGGLVVTLLALDATVPRQARSQNLDAAQTWQSLATRIDPGREVQLRLRSGQRFAATLIRADDQAMVVLPKTRLAVPPQPISYDQIVSLELRDSSRMSAGKMVAIGLGAGAAAFLGILLVVLTTVD
jgi:small nuclear ribonucleoprotein (snRNP)-like protein